MFYYAYIIKSITPGTNKTYAGYSSNVDKRLSKHNSNNGAKSTKGYKWKLVFQKKFKSKSDAMSYEYKLKKDRIFRKKILQKFDK
ncbi:GIY-YIG nuclease family protein [Candidatus Pelagibacter sp. HIMB1495]|uniref:GIY-YIG nuclease family protein n=1 Tax=unclassified Candidatus Pelagibacter TaxID=2647897 RepID=UPI003F8285BC